MWLGNTMGLAARWALLLHLACGLQAVCAALAPHCSRAASRDVLRVVQQVRWCSPRANRPRAAATAPCTAAACRPAKALCPYWLPLQILLPDGQAGNLLAASASSCPLLGPDR